MDVQTEHRHFAMTGDEWADRPNHSERPQGSDGWDIDPRRLQAIVYRNRWVVITICAGSLLFGAAATMLTAPTYQAQASVQVDQKTAKVVGTEEQDVTSAAETERFLQTQVDILKSRGLAERVLRQTRATHNARFRKAVGLEPQPEGLGEAVLRKQALGALQKRLNVKLPTDSRVIRIAFDSRDPVVSADMANAFVRSYIEANVQRRFDQSAYARKYLEGQLAATKARLEQSEQGMIRYSRSSRLIDASAGVAGGAESGSPKSLTTSNLVELNQSYSQARSARVLAEAKWNQVKAAPLMSVPEVVEDAGIRDLRQRRSEVQATYDQELERHKADYPSVRQAVAAMAAIDRDIQIAAQRIRNSIQQKYVVARQQEEALAQNVDALQADTLAEQDRSVQYNILKREADTNRALYDALLQRYKELSAEAGATYNNISIVDLAVAPGAPISPQPVTNMALAALAGVILSLLAIVLRQRFGDAIREPSDVSAQLGLPLLGTIPKVSTGEEIGDEFTNPSQPLMEAHFSILPALALSTSGGTPRSLLITSSRQDEGKSTTALSLARVFALSGRRVLLIDGDMRKPTIHRMAGLNKANGLSTVLAGTVAPDEAIVPSGIDNLSIMTSGPIPPSPPQLLEGDALPALLDSLADRFDQVIIDGPPVLGLADAPRLASVAGGAVFVIEANLAHRGAARMAVNRLIGAGANLLGAVLTKFDAREAGYEYDGYYSYGDKKVVAP